MLSTEDYEEILDCCGGHMLNTLLEYSQPNPHELAPPDFTFEDRKKIFFWLLEKLMRNGHLLLAKNGKFLEGTIEEQVNLFRKILPTPKYPYPTELIPEDVWSQMSDRDKMEMYLWFFSKDCPAGAVWMAPNGYLEWT